MNWPLVRVNSVSEINPRLPKGTDEAQEVSFLGMASVSEDGYLLDEELRVLSDTKKGFTYFAKGDVLLAKITPCFENGKCLRPNQITSNIGFGSTEFHVIRASEEHLDSKYLFYMLWSDHLRLYGRSSMSGAAGQKRVPADFIKGYQIPLPPLKEQKRIAAILDKADNLRLKRQQAIQLADEFLRAVFLDMFGDPVTNPKGWDVKPLKDMAKVTTGNTPSRSEPDYYGDYIEWIKSDNINTPSNFLTTAKECLSEKGYEVGRHVSAGSTLITCIAGSFDCIGNAAFADRQVAFNQQINALTPKQGINSWFLYALVIFSKTHIQAASTNSMKGMISKGKMEVIQFICPSESLQMKFEKVFSHCRDNREKMDESMLEINNMFSSINQKAFSGQL
ncbi:MAG: type I restriction enzyme S subunit [Gammaproteobacteria bacterium]